MCHYFIANYGVDNVISHNWIVFSDKFTNNFKFDMDANTDQKNLFRSESNSTESYH